MSSPSISNLSKEEFRALFRYNLFDKLELYSNLCPIRRHNVGNGYDSAEKIKEKMGKFFIIDKNTPMSPYDYKVDMKVTDISLSNVAELEKFIAELSRKLSNYKMALMAGESMDATVDRFLLRIQSFMDKRELPQYATEVVAVLSELTKIAQLSDKEKEYFYKSLANAKITKQKFYDILGYTCEDFKFIVKETSLKKSNCNCPTELSEAAVKYPSKSSAILQAESDILAYQNRTPLTLTVSKCPDGSGYWHYWIQIV